MNILAIGCHPDDLEINCYGTLAKCVKRGDTVTVATVANGCMGHEVIMPKELAEIRKKEAYNAAMTIGAKEYVCLDADDLTITQYNEDLIRKCVELIRRVKPDVLITQYYDDYARDHVETSLLVFNALFVASIPHYFTESPCYNGKCALYYMTPATISGFEPSEYVTINDEMDIKIKALACHESQVVWLRDHNGLDVLNATRSMGETYGRQAQTKYAEGFKICKHKLKMSTGRLLP